MGRPPAKDLTERELEVMHVFWSRGEVTAAEARDRLAATGLDRTYHHDRQPGARAPR